MKTAHEHTLLLRIPFLIPCFFMLIICNASIASDKLLRSHPDTCVAVTFENNIEKNELKIKVKSRTGAAMKLFIFTPDGILINGVAVAANEITTVKSLDK